MQRSLHLAGAALLCAAVLLASCAKKTTDQTTQTSTDTTQSAASPSDAGASAAPSDGASAIPSDAGAPASASAGAGGYIDLPVYPGAAESKAQAMSMSANTGSVAITVYSTKDDAKAVAEWYKSHLPAEFKGGVLTAGDKTVGTFSEEHADGDQSVVVANQPDGTTRIQLATKHGK